MRGQNEVPEEGQQNRANAGEKLERGRHPCGPGIGLSVSNPQH